MKRLFILSVALALMLGCATIKSNPEGQLTTLPYDSKYDPNSFYDFDASAMPQQILMEDGSTGLAVFLSNPDPKGNPQEAVLIFGTGDVLLAYGWEANDGEIFVYTLNDEKTKYVRYTEEDKTGGI